MKQNSHINQYDTAEQGLTPKFSYINHESGKVTTSYFSETYFENVGAKTIFCEVIGYKEENNSPKPTKRIKFSEIGRYVKSVVSINQFMGNGKCFCQ